MNDEIQTPEAQSELMHSQAPNDGPGALLKKTRLQLKLEIADVAEGLHLSRNVVEKIEQDNYKKFAGVTFIKGYLRAYAKYLGLDANEVINKFNALNITEPERPPVQRVIVKEIKVGGKPIQWMSYVIALALGSLVIVWWHNHSNPEQSRISHVKQLPETMDNNTTNATNAQLSEAQVKKSALAKPSSSAKPASTKPAKLNTQPKLENNSMPSKVKVADTNKQPIQTTVATQDDISTSMDDISTQQHASAQKKQQKAHEGLKQFSGWQNPDIE
ncbi:MAG: hypothetical protein CMF49_06740 [Legionellales bacterium]|nr:hypothetical protein [Legionellales bacterium]|tara:strand:- start:1331 stop:2149 length:819 start_codon:yes stop_codon:yes gene_type:complete